MSYNIGPKIGIDGEKEFRDQIKSINTAYKTMEAELKAVSAAYDANGDEAGKLTATVKVLEKQIDEQRKKLPLLEDAIAKASKKYGENSTEVTRLQGVMYDTQATISGLEKKLRDAESGLTETEEAVEDLSDEMDDAGDSAGDFGDILKGNLAADLISKGLEKLVDLVKEFASGCIEAAADVKAANAQFEQTFSDMEKQATDALEAVADETGITATRMQDSYTALFAFAKTVGADSATALDISNRAMSAAADSAAYYDKSIEQVTETLQSFLKGNYENDAALGIAATETTRNTKANELYAKSFNELSEAQKVDVLLAMVEAGNKASGALGQAAREADSWANVTGELAESVRQLQAAAGEPFMELLIPVIQSLTDSMKKLLETTDAEELRDYMSDFSDTMHSINAEFDNTVEKSEAAVYAAEGYIERLEALESAGLSTVEAQYEYKRIIEDLQALIPGLNLVIDEQTGLLVNNKAAILEDVAAWKNATIIEATQRKLSESSDAYGDAQLTVIEAKYKLKTAIKDEEILADRLEAKYIELAQAQAELDDFSTNYAGTLEGYSAQYEQLFNRVSDLQGEYNALSIQLDKNIEGQADLTIEIENAENTLIPYEEEIRFTEAALKDYQKEQGLVEDGTENLTDSTDDLTDQIAQLEKAYEDATAAARESIDSQIGYFDELSDKNDYSAKKIIENWRAQREAFAQYENNLKKAVDLGLDDTLVQQLSDGSYESMLILDALVNDTAISVDQINSEFADMSESRDAVADVLGDIESDFIKTMDALVSAAGRAGINTMDGLINAIHSKIGDLDAAMEIAAKVAISGYNGPLGIHSPSRVMEDGGEDTMDGAIIGIDNRIAAFRAKMEEAATAGSNAFLQSRLEEVENYPTYGAGAVVNQTSTSTVRHEYGGVAIQIYPQAHQSANDIADMVLDKLNRLVVVEGGSLGG